MHPVPQELMPLAEVPVETVAIVGGVYFRSVFLKKWTVIPQHTHDHDHATYVGSGRVRLWVNSVWSGDYQAGAAIEIRGGNQHIFQALEDFTRLICVWPESVGALLPEAA